MDNATINIERNLFPISLRLMRVILGLLLLYLLAVEKLFFGTWEIVVAVTCAYALITGLFGKDPLFALFRLSVRPLPFYVLNIFAQLECLIVGVVCVVTGLLNFHINSTAVMLLPFLGIYPIMLCAIKHDLLGYLMLSYRREREQLDGTSCLERHSERNSSEKQF